LGGGYEKKLAVTNSIKKEVVVVEASSN